VNVEKTVTETETVTVTVTETAMIGLYVDAERTVADIVILAGKCFGI
jgi:hypothetical protein